MFINSEGGYKLEVDEVKEEAEKVTRQGVLLNLPASYWEQFLNENGSLNKKKLADAGHDGEGAYEWIHEQMVERGWIGGKKAGGDDDAAADSSKAPVRKK
jgi:hypothetical protein